MADDLKDAIVNAMNVLPSDCVIRIELEQGSCIVTLVIDNAVIEKAFFPVTIEALAENINEAVDYAQSTLG